MQMAFANNNIKVLLNILYNIPGIFPNKLEELSSNN